MIKIFGERNTSTNALKAVIEKNSESRILPSVMSELDPRAQQRDEIARKLRLPHKFRERLIDRVFEKRSPLEAWKHRVTDFGDVTAFTGCHVIFCARHPASWVLGLYKNPYHIHGYPPSNFGAFLDKRWRTVGREGLKRAETTATTLYNLKMAAFIDLQVRFNEIGVSYSVVRHEDFAIDQAAVFAQLASHLLRPTSEFQALDKSTKNPKKTKNYYKDYYGQQRWRDEIDPYSMSRISEEIDWSLVTSLDYAPV